MRISFALLLLLGLTNNALSQHEMVGASGTYTLTTGLGVSWSIGEVVTLTAVSTTEAVTQGFQQGDIWAVSTNDVIAKDLGLNVYPNPAVDFVTVNARSTVGLTILSAEGKLIETIQVNSNRMEIDISTYPRGIYFFHFTDSDGIQFKVVRVVKN